MNKFLVIYKDGYIDLVDQVVKNEKFPIVRIYHVAEEIDLWNKYWKAKEEEAKILEEVENVDEYKENVKWLFKKARTARANSTA